MLTVHHGGILPPSAEPTLPGENPDENLPALPFRYMFPDLQEDPENLLPESGTTVADLTFVGSKGMEDRAGIMKEGIPVPAIHTFLGQFIDHDITLMDDRGAQITLKTPTPLSPDQLAKIVNARSPNLDLDNVYGPDFDGNLSPLDPDDPRQRKMKIAEVRPVTGLPDGVIDDLQDLPRLADGTAQIGDPRNDENLIIAQLHVAFLRAHNAICDRYPELEFEDVKKLLIQHYQWVVLNNFLEQICDPGIVSRIRNDGPTFFNPSPDSFYMPLEFSVAAYRFGHSKVRAEYPEFNSKQGTGSFDLLFQFTHRRLPDSWVIAWPRFVEIQDPLRSPRRIDTTLSHPLLSLDDKQLNGHDPGFGNLAVRNLLRGYILRMPTGQAVAKAMASVGIQPMAPDQIRSVAEQILLPPTQTQADILNQTQTNFYEKTPLWFYILAEAAYYGGGIHLGPVGSTIVAEVLIGVMRNSTYSILKEPDWKPTLGETPGKFDIADLLKVARVLF